MPPKPPLSEFAKNLKALRKERKITMKKLADKLGVSESFISRLESGQRKPSKQFILELGEVLFPEGNPDRLDQLLIMADFTPINLDSFTGKNHLIDIFQESLNKDPQNFRAYISLILSLIKQGKYSVAKTKIDHGMTLFDDSVQLQSLLSALELAKGNYELAIEYQASAIKYFESKNHLDHCYLSKEDLLLNLGSFHFIYGHQLVVESYDESKTGPELKALKKKAKTILKKSKAIFDEALQLAPEDIYILDEYARVNFNLTYLATPKEKKTLYAETITAYRKIIFSPQKRLLNYQDLIESTVFLGYAYAKNEQYEEANYHMNVVESCLPNYWLIHYIKACLYTLEYEKMKKDHLLDEALNALEISLSIKDDHNYSSSEALTDPDLKTLRQKRQLQFQNIVKQGANS